MSLHLALFNIYQQQQRYGEAVDEFVKVEVLGGVPPENTNEFKTTFQASGWEAFNRLLLSKADVWAAQSGRARPWPYIGIYAQLLDKEKTLHWLQSAVESHDVAVLQLKVEPAYDFLRDDPRYVELLKRIGQKP